MSAIVRSKAFRSGNSIAVRLPRAFGIKDGMELQIEQRGRDLVVSPVAEADEDRARLVAFIARLRAIPAPGILEERDDTLLPEPPGL